MLWHNEWGAVLHVGTLGWQDLVERELPHNALWDLAKAILLLFGKLEVKDRTNHLMLTILEELIGIIFSCHIHFSYHTPADRHTRITDPHVRLRCMMKTHLTGRNLLVLLLISSHSPAMAYGECGPAPGAVWQQSLLHHSSQQGHQWTTSWDLQTHCVHNTGENTSYFYDQLNKQN